MRSWQILYIMRNMKPFSKNPRQITEKKLARLKDTLSRLGDLSGIVHNLTTDEIIGGHQRMKVFEGAAEIVVSEKRRKPDDQGTVGLGYIIWHGKKYNYRQVRWNSETATEANIAANLGAGDWDWDKIANEWDPSDLKKWGMDFDELRSWKKDISGLSEMLKSSEEEPVDAEPQIDKAEELQKIWKVKIGDLWQIGKHRLLCGDSTKREDVERVMGGENAGAVVTDPPYGINQEGIDNDNPEGLSELFKGCLSVMPIENAVIIAFQSPRLFPVWLDAARAAGHKFERMLWMYKPNDVCYPWRGWLQKSEAILVSSIGKTDFIRVDPYAHDCYISNWDSETKKEIKGWHASIKPLPLIQDLTSRVEGDVYEPFCGSGTTMVACQNLNRKCRAIEISPAYCAVTLQRMQDAFPEIKIKLLKSAKMKREATKKK